MGWYLAPALAQLRSEVNALWPRRDKTSDGTVGDLAHQQRKSDHNPDPWPSGIVRAWDCDENLTPGGDAWSLVEQIIRDPRVAYVIYEGRIWQSPAAFPGKGGWRAYTGANAHRHHVHTSVRRGAQWDSDRRLWGIERSEVLSDGDSARTALTPDPQGDDDMPTLVKSNDGTFYLIHPLGVQTLTSMAQVTPWTAMGVKVTDLANGDVTQVRGVVDALRKQLVDQTAAEVVRRLGSSVTVPVDELATKTARSLAPLLSLLPDKDIERIVQAVTDGNELTEGYDDGPGVQHYRRRVFP